MPASPGGYVSGVQSGQFGRTTEVDAKELLFEFMLNALRLQDGFDLSLFSERTGLPQSALEPYLEKILQQDWIRIEDGHLSLTKRGKVYLNNVVSAFL